MGAICVAGNVTATTCTKYVNIMYKYISKYVEDGMIKILLGESAENDSNILNMQQK